MNRVFDKQLNCWEIKDCERADPDSSDPCPVISSTGSNGVNDGKNAGRYCWRIAGTYCNGKTQGQFADKVSDCSECEVFTLVLRQQGSSFQI